jgi:hypothetical protein
MLTTYLKQWIKSRPRCGLRNAVKFYPPWTRSIRSGDYSPLQAKELWMNLSCCEFLERNLDEAGLVAEFGGGGSTHYFLRKGHKVVTVEHDESWLHVLSHAVAAQYAPNSWTCMAKTPENRPTEARLEYVADPDLYCSADNLGLEFKSYASALDSYPNASFSCILVDGRARPSCIKHAVPKVRKGGLLVIDNTERPYYLSPKVLNHLHGFAKVFDEYAPVKGLMSFTRATVYRLPN